MFQRRDAHNLPPDLVINFKKSFPCSGWNSVSEPQDLLASPERTITPSTDTEVTMNFNPSHYVNQDDGIGHTVSPDNLGEWSTSEGFPNHGSELFSIFNDMQTPFQHTPVTSSYGQHPHFLASSVQLHEHQHAIPTPQSVTAPNSAALFGHASYVNSQGQNLHALHQHPQNYHHYPQTTGQPPLPLDYSHASAFITPGRLDLSEKNNFESVGGHGEEFKDQLKFRVTLMTGTAMVKEGELPVTYLNKCQPYRVIVKDTRPEHYAYGPVTYRTFIRVSFNEQQQRERAAHCWQLWKDGRGTTEAQQRGTKPFAVEYVPQNPSQQHLANIAIQQETFDGFCFHWTPTSGRTSECEIHLRCNFLSTDFSHSKGVKGIPVRLCAKTEILSGGQRDQVNPPEICYCKVKLFRDHGAERKLSNDEAHVKKSIVKIEEQIRQARADHDESVFTSTGKRRPSESYHLGNNRSSKVSRLKRTASVSSDSSNGLRDSLDGDLQMKLAVLNETLRSKRDVSILFLRGDEQDDPDEYPVKLPDSTDQAPESPVELNQPRRSTLLTATSGDDSPVMAATTIPPSGRHYLNLQTQTSFGDWGRGVKLEAESGLHSTNPQHLASPPDQTPKVEIRTKTKVDSSHEQIEVCDLDPYYVPPTQHKPRAVACFFVRYSMNGDAPFEPYYRAVYLQERSETAFTQALAQKQNISLDQVVETVRIREQVLLDGNNTQVQIKIDDDVVSDIVEGQDMRADFASLLVDQESNELEAERVRFRLTIKFNEPLRSKS